MFFWNYLGYLQKKPKTLSFGKNLALATMTKKQQYCLAIAFSITKMLLCVSNLSHFFLILKKKLKN